MTRKNFFREKGIPDAVVATLFALFIATTLVAAIGKGIETPILKMGDPTTEGRIICGIVSLVTGSFLSFGFFYRTNPVTEDIDRLTDRDEEVSRLFREDAKATLDVIFKIHRHGERYDKEFMEQFVKNRRFLCPDGFDNYDDVRRLRSPSRSATKNWKIVNTLGALRAAGLVRRVPVDDDVEDWTEGDIAELRGELAKELFDKA